MLTATLVGSSLHASALPFAIDEAHSTGMDSTGVASSNITPGVCARDNDPSDTIT
ncbi:MAG: hypothetical protein SV201_07325 [Pseudomonadota bacterium]|nr:hypothetical protein [Pseudomonadota bacterium]